MLNPKPHFIGRWCLRSYLLPDQENTKAPFSTFGSAVQVYEKMFHLQWSGMSLSRLSCFRLTRWILVHSYQKLNRTFNAVGIEDGENTYPQDRCIYILMNNNSSIISNKMKLSFTVIILKRSICLVFNFVLAVCRDSLAVVICINENTHKYILLLNLCRLIIFVLSVM